MGPRKAEIHEHHDASERGGGSGADIMIGVEDGAVFLWIQSACDGVDRTRSQNITVTYHRSAYVPTLTE
jgi:hypothetical protein